MFEPLFDRVAVKRLAAETISPGGIVIPDTAQDKQTVGEVMFVGPGAFEDGVRRPVSVKVGDKVLFGKWSGNEITIKGDELLVMKESDIIGILQ